MNLILVDGSNLFYRAFFVVKYDKTRQYHGAPGWLEAHVFYSTLLANISPYLPAAVVVCWDSLQSKYRLQLYPDYKKQRRTKRDADDIKGQARLRSVLNDTASKLGLINVSVPGVEADDLIAYLWKQNVNQYNIIIMSNDQDLQQFPRSIVINDRNAAVVVTKESARQQVVTKILKGDRSDNIKGVHGFGGKRGDDLLKTCNYDYDAVLGHFAEALETVNQLSLNRKLVNLRLTLNRVIGPEERRAINLQLQAFQQVSVHGIELSSYLSKLGLKYLSRKDSTLHEIRRANNSFCRRTLRQRDDRTPLNTISV